jgi:hypothetical protein
MKVVAKPIDIAVWFDCEGTPHPIRFRLEGEDKTYETSKIDKVTMTYMEKIAGNPTMVFRCRGVSKEEDKLYEIRYETNSCKWILFKI